MKIIITENKVEKLKSLIKNGGPRMVIQLMGGLDTFSKVLDIKGPMGFLHLFDGLDVAQSYHKDFILYRYEPGNNIMVYDKLLKCLYINIDYIWEVMSDDYGQDQYAIQDLTKLWFKNVYNIEVKRSQPLIASKYLEMI